jgi:hypothetical protein
MFRPNFLSCLMWGINQGINRWSQFREDRRKLERWFRKGVVGELDFLAEGENWLALHLGAAVRCRSEGLVFVERNLRGLMEWETSDDYWSLKPMPELSKKPATDEALQYMVRYGNMSRIDIYYIHQGEPLLRRGIPLSFENHLDVLRTSLQSPRAMTFRIDEEDVHCRYSLHPGMIGGFYPLLFVDIAYDKIEE